MPIARTVAEAQVGDLLWLYDGNQNRYDENRKYLGRGVWKIVIVRKVARVYLSAGPVDWHHTSEFRIDTGEAKTANGYTPSEQLAGWKDRADRFWLSQAGDMGRAITSSKDIEILKEVGFALGVAGPPDFSIEPPKEPKKP